MAVSQSFRVELTARGDMVWVVVPAGRASTGHAKCEKGREGRMVIPRDVKDDP
jgi:hypothetical protein